MASPPTETRARKVLVVDDSPVNRYVMSRVLRARNFETLECSTGSQALQLAKEDIDAVVLDVHLPDLHGFEVCRLMREDPASAQLPIVHVSAIALSAQDRLSGLAAGADAYYTSPVEPDVLTATVDALIRARARVQVHEERERLFRGAFDKAPCAMVLIDEMGRIAEANTAFVKLMQSTRKALLRRGIAGLVPKEWTADVEEILAIWPRQAWHGRFPLINPAGQRLSLEWGVTRHPMAGWSIAVVTETGGKDPQPKQRG